MAQTVAIVTGSAQGIGRAIALRLAEDGYDVGLNDIPAKASELSLLASEVKAKGRKACVVAADVSDEEAVKNMVETVVKELGSLDVMVSNGAVFMSKTIMETTVNEWDRVQSVNSRGTFLCYKYSAKQMISQGRGGRIIGASSIVAKQSDVGMSAYSASKCAVVALTQAAAKEFGPHGITVNCYAPGAVDTSMLSSSVADPINDLAKVAAMSAFGRLGKPEEIAGTVSFLASKDATWVTGQSIGVNGGIIFH
ncbi:hypothetical protein VKT23_009158 [Stygiomarasmius scandens]|uniref:Uncharacterized protein n=1 Tax=Marasmiellus scandens TaxID=2682957 RepID=A0ABR1JEM0_9AGAR